MFNFKKHLSYEQLLCNDGNARAEVNERLRSIRHATAKSKSGVWGPTHSDSEDEDEENDLEMLNKTTGDRSGGTNTTQDDSFSCSLKESSPDSKTRIENTNTSISKLTKTQEQRNHNATDPSTPLSPFQCAPSNENEGLISGIIRNASAAFNELLLGDCSGACNQCQGNELLHRKPRKNDKKSTGSTQNKNTKSKISATTLGIQRLSPPSKEISLKYQRSNASSLTDGIDEKIVSIQLMSNLKTKEESDEEAREAAKVMAETTKKMPHGRSFAMDFEEITTRNSSMEKKNAKNRTAPFTVILVDSSVPFQKSISELTMRSSYGEATTPISDVRRMAYYAVGKNHSQDGKKGGVNNGGNRKCYFTGDPILSGRPFYAGSVQQGMRTLIVFCLPSALGLPKKEDLERIAEIEVNSQLDGRKSPDELSRRTMTGLSTAALSQHDSIYNEEGFVMSELFHSTAWTEDENGNLCESLNTEFLLQALPDPNRDLLLCMQESFPEQFASLSPHLRRPQCWRLYVKFCFFSGLPIADGEMYYKVMDDVIFEARGRKSNFSDEIVLSHEVMEAVSGESADLRILPGNNTFKYLQKHYKQQCAKLSPQKFADKVFDRSSWIRVMPEV